MHLTTTASREVAQILTSVTSKWPRCSLEGLILKLKLQYFGHLTQRVDSLEKTLMLGGIGGRRRRGQHWVALSPKFPQVVLRTFRPGPYPKHAARASLSSTHLLVAEVSIWATSLLAVVVRCIFCGVFFFFFLPVMLPSEITKLSTELTMRGFPAVWKSFLHDSLPRMGLCSP